VRRCPEYPTGPSSKVAVGRSRDEREESRRGKLVRSYERPRWFPPLPRGDSRGVGSPLRETTSSAPLGAGPTNGSPPYQGGARGGGVPRRERTYLP
jgi:hypothetical protein